MEGDGSKRRRKVLMLPVGSQTKRGPVGVGKEECWIDHLELREKDMAIGQKSMLDLVPCLTKEQKQEFLLMMIPSIPLDLPESQAKLSVLVDPQRPSREVLRMVCTDSSPFQLEIPLMVDDSPQRVWKDICDISMTFWRKLAPEMVEEKTNELEFEEVLAISSESSTVQIPELAPISYVSIEDGVSSLQESRLPILRLEEPCFLDERSTERSFSIMLCSDLLAQISAGFPYAEPSNLGCASQEIYKSSQEGTLELIENSGFMLSQLEQEDPTNGTVNHPTEWQSFAKDLLPASNAGFSIENPVFSMTSTCNTLKAGLCFDMLPISMPCSIRNEGYSGRKSTFGQAEECLLPVDLMMDDVMIQDPNDFVLVIPVPKLPTKDVDISLMVALVKDLEIGPQSVNSFALYFDWSLIDTRNALHSSQKQEYASLFEPCLQEIPTADIMDEMELFYFTIGTTHYEKKAEPSPDPGLDIEIARQHPQATSGPPPQSDNQKQMEMIPFGELRFFKKLRDRHQHDGESRHTEDNPVDKSSRHSLTEIFSVLPDLHCSILNNLLVDTAALVRQSNLPKEISSEVRKLEPDLLKKLEGMIYELRGRQLPSSDDREQPELQRLIMIYILYQSSMCLLHYGIRASNLYISQNLEKMPHLSRFVEGKSLERLSESNRRVEHGELMDCPKLDSLQKQLQEIRNAYAEPKILLLIDNQAAFSVIDTLANARFKPLILDKTGCLLNEEGKVDQGKVISTVEEALSEHDCIMITYSHLCTSFPHQVFDCILQYVEYPLGSTSSESSKILETFPTNRVIFHIKVATQGTDEAFAYEKIALGIGTEPLKQSTVSPTWNSTLVVNKNESIELKKNKAAWQTVLLAERGQFRIVEREMAPLVDAVITPGCCLIFKEMEGFLGKYQLSQEKLLERITDIFLVVSFSFDTCMLLLDIRHATLDVEIVVTGMIYLAAELTKVKVQLFLCKGDSDIKKSLRSIMHAPDLLRANSLTLESVETTAEALLNSCPSMNPLAVSAILKSYGSFGKMLEHDYDRLLEFCSFASIPKRSMETLMQQLHGIVDATANDISEFQTHGKTREALLKSGENISVEGANVQDEGISSCLPLIGEKPQQMAHTQDFPRAILQRKRLQAPQVHRTPQKIPRVSSTALLSPARFEEEGTIMQTTCTARHSNDATMADLPINVFEQIPGQTTTGCYTRPSSAASKDFSSWLGHARHLEKQSSKLPRQALKEESDHLLDYDTPVVDGMGKTKDSSIPHRFSSSRNRDRSKLSTMRKAIQPRLPKEPPKKGKALGRRFGLSMKPLASASLAQLSGSKKSPSSLEEYSYRGKRDDPPPPVQSRQTEREGGGSEDLSTRRTSTSVQLDYTPPDKIAKRTLAFRPQKGCGGQSRLFWR